MRHFRPVLSHAECAHTLRHLANLYVIDLNTRVSRLVQRADREPQQMILRRLGRQLEMLAELSADIETCCAELEERGEVMAEFEIPEAE